jgi:hypothetical protein
MTKRKRIVAAVGVVLLVGLVLIYPWRVELGVGGEKMTVRFVVTDAQTGEPVQGAHIALHDSAREVTILRTGADGVAELNTECTFTSRVRENPITGWRGRPTYSARGPERLVVMTAGGYRPPEPWWLGWQEYHTAEKRDSRYEVTVPLSLVPHAAAP